MSDTSALSPPVPPRRPWLRRLAIAAATFVGLVVVAWLAVPPIVRSQLESRLTEALGRWHAAGLVDEAASAAILAGYRPSRRFDLSRLLLTLGAAFVGVPTNGKVPGARGITFHIYDADGLIKREESFWDAATAVAELGLPVDPTAVAKLPALV